MLRKFTIGLFAVSLVLSVIIAIRNEMSAGQLSESKGPQPAVEPPAGNGDSKALKPANALPISQVVLFNSGVGYFHRSGMVEGDARVDLQFQTGDINDLIKSLVLHDANGRALPVRYDSQEPIEKALHSFAINLSGNPTYGEILNQARGEKVEITLAAGNSALPATLQGTIIGMEEARRPGAAVSGPGAAIETELLNLMCAEGLRSVPLTQISRLRFLSPALENELRRALEVVAGGHDSQKKTVRLGFRGDGKREVRVGYVTENPIWKTNYRVVVDKNGKTRLIGWANVENTSDEDWHDIKLTLVSARPISFQMDLYPPLFIPRPTVEPELFASLRPPTYAGPLNGQPGFGFGGGQTGVGGAPVVFNGNVGGGPVVFNGNFGGFQCGGGNGAFGAGAAGGLYNGGRQGGIAGFGGGGFGFNGAQGGAVDPAQDAGTPMNAGQSGFQGFNGFNPGAQALNRYQTRSDAFVGGQRLNFKDLQKRRNETKGRVPDETAQQARQVGSALTNVEPDLIESALTAAELGSPARFVIDEKVTLPRQQSAMIPILDQPIEAARVSIYNQDVQAKHPLFGLKIKNTSKQALMQGPIAVYDDDHYAGDARILDLQPGEERFISYAIDTGVEVAPFDSVVPAPEMVVRMDNNRLQVQYKLRSTRAYVIRNRSPEARRVVIEQPVRDGWRFTEARKNVQLAAGRLGADGVQREAAWKAGDVEKPDERTRHLYRFSVDVETGATVKYEVGEEQPRFDPFESSRLADGTGFATTLGLDVWAQTQRTPEGQFGLEAPNAILRVTHKDRRTTTYHVKNRVGAERTVALEHVAPNGRRLIGDAQPAFPGTQRYRFKLVIPPGQTLTQAVVEESVDAVTEEYRLKSGAPVSLNQPLGELPAERFITDLGFEVWRTHALLPPALIGARFIKGELHTDARDEDLATYHVRSLAAGEQSFILDHLVSDQWSYVGAAKPVEGQRNRYRFTLKVGKGQIVAHEVKEQRTMSRKEALGELSDDRAKALIASPAIGGAVKENIVKGRTLLRDLAQADAAWKDLRAQLAEITDEQSRIRYNLEKLPVTSDVYKRLIDKFDKQETALESVQKQSADKSAQQKLMRDEFARFLERLSAE
jgi:hypothetical protein